MACTSNYALRLLTSVRAEAEKVAAAEGITLNQFINGPVMEKLAARQTTQFVQERAARADRAVSDRLLRRAGNEPPRLGDEIDDDTRHALRTRKSPARPRRGVRPSAKAPPQTAPQRGTGRYELSHYESNAR